MFQLWYSATLLALETQQVMFLRTARMMRGGKVAEREAYRMITEKMIAAYEASGQLASGTPPEHVVRKVRKIVKANKRRLEQSG